MSIWGLSKSKQERFLRAGRGTGAGSNYKPWLEVADWPGRGRAHRVPSNGRVVHLISDAQYLAYLHVRWDCHSCISPVTDIRENYPLLPVVETVDIARELCVQHATVHGSKDPTVYLTSLLVDRQYAETEAILIIADCDIEKPSVCVAMHIQEEYWSRRGVKWTVQRHSQLKTQRGRNLKWLFNASPGDVSSFIPALMQFFTEEPSQQISEACRLFDQLWRLERGTALAAVRTSLCYGILSVDLDRSDIPLLPCQFIEFRQ